MSKLKKTGLIGLAVVLILTIILKIAGIFPGIAAGFALPFCMMLLIDYSRKKSDSDENK
jgi:hypothetical protein